MELPSIFDEARRGEQSRVIKVNFQRIHFLLHILLMKSQGKLLFAIQPNCNDGFYGFAAGTFTWYQETVKHSVEQGLSAGNLWWNLWESRAPAAKGLEILLLTWIAAQFVAILSELNDAVIQTFYCLRCVVESKSGIISESCERKPKVRRILDLEFLEKGFRLHNGSGSMKNQPCFPWMLKTNRS